MDIQSKLSAAHPRCRFATVCGRVAGRVVCADLPVAFPRTADDAIAAAEKMTRRSAILAAADLYFLEMCAK